MKTKFYNYGPHKCKAYFKAVGKGWEVGFHFGSKQIFVGNFLHRKEANAWWTKMNTEFKNFSKKYLLTDNTPVTFYSKFLSNHFYKTYYKYLDSQFATYERTFNKAVVTDLKKYKKMKAERAWKKADSFKVKHRTA